MGVIQEVDRQNVIFQEVESMADSVCDCMKHIVRVSILPISTQL